MNQKYLKKSYDYIIAGAGCAGLSLAYRLNQSNLKEKKILVVDKIPKNTNDRTWCFWSDKSSIFDEIVCQSWEKIWFRSPHFSKLIDLPPYHYKMIRGLDFYHFILHDLQKNTNIEMVFGEVSEMQSTASRANLKINGELYEADWIFNSIPPIRSFEKTAYHYLKQHFKGWWIESEEAYFNPHEATFMDFRIEQNKECRFFYVLPLSEKKALVEFTLFSKNLLADTQAYDVEIKKYLQDFLPISNYQIVEEEFGIIPMIDEPFECRNGNFIINIGTAGGSTKASSGYTFMNIQEQCGLIAKALLETGKPLYKAANKSRFRLYDSILLNIIENNRYPTRDIFANLFKKHPIERIFRFLDEKSSFWEELKIFIQMPQLPFIKTLPQELGKKRL